MEDEVKWFIGGEVEEKDTGKMNFVQEVPITDDMPPGQKLFAQNYNDMRAMLLKNNLMKKR